MHYPLSLTPLRLRGPLLRSSGLLQRFLPPGIRSLNLAFLSALLYMACSVSTPPRPSYDRGIGRYQGLILDREFTGYTESGFISFYGNEFQGRKTASGELFDNQALTAAHKSLPFNTLVKVRNPRNGKSVVVKINDRGPFHKSRILDLSHEAARRLGFIGQGTIRATLTVL